MTTSEIPKEHWVRFLDQFSRMHEGWLVTVQIFGLGVGDQVEAFEAPLRGMGADVRVGDGDITVTVGSPESHLTRIISNPRRLHMKTSEGADEVIAVEAEDTTTLLTFRSASAVGDDGVIHR